METHMEEQNSWNANTYNTKGYDCSHLPAHTEKCLLFLFIYLLKQKLHSSESITKMNGFNICSMMCSKWKQHH